MSKPKPPRIAVNDDLVIDMMDAAFRLQHPFAHRQTPLQWARALVRWWNSGPFREFVNPEAVK